MAEFAKLLNNPLTKNWLRAVKKGKPTPIGWDSRGIAPLKSANGLAGWVVGGVAFGALFGLVTGEFWKGVVAGMAWLVLMLVVELVRSIHRTRASRVKGESSEEPD